MQLFVLLLGAFAATAARHSLPPQFKDSAIIVDADKPLPSNTATLPYYQPVQNQPTYRILNKPKNQGELFSTTDIAPNSAAIFTQEEFPRDLLEIAQQKLGLKTLDEVPSITELAELLGTNSAAETISYIRQLTSTDQGVALMRAYIESSDYTDSAGSKENQVSTTQAPKTTAAPTKSATQPGFFDGMAAFLSIYNVQPQHKQVMQQFKKVAAVPQLEPNSFKNLLPLYVRNPLPYHYPIPLRPISVNRTALRKSYGRPIMVASQIPPSTRPHLNTLKALNPAYIQQIARIANVSPNKLASFLQQKPKLAELAAKVARFPSAQERSPLADGQLLAAVQKVMEHDEDLKKLIAANTLM